MVWQIRSKGTFRKRTSGMNKLESDFCQTLEDRKRAGEIVWYAYEAINLRLADRTFWKPDFLAMLADGTLVIYECKGFMEGHALVRIKVAAEMYPFPIIIVKAIPKKQGGGWKEEII